MNQLQISSKTYVESKLDQTSRYLSAVLRRMADAVERQEYEASDMQDAIVRVHQVFRKLEGYRLLNDIRKEELYVVNSEGHLVPVSFS